MVVLTKIFLLAGVMQAITAFTISDDAEDGVYSVSTNDQGIDIHVKLANTTTDLEIGPQLSTRELEHSRLFKRAGFTISCGGTYNMHRENTDAANAELDKQCRNGVNVPPRHNFYSIRGNVVAFFCNFGSAKMCYTSSRKADSKYVTDHCGWYNSGWTTVWNDVGQHWSYGYDSRESIFCGVGA